MKKLIIILIFSSIILSQERILIDENYSDWENVTTKYSDPSGDNTGGPFDFKNFWVSNDDDYLYFRIQTGDEIVLVNGNYMTLFIDADNNANTGRAINGVGAELEYTFGERDGKAYLNGEENINHRDLGFFGAPTYSAEQFEFAIKRNAQISGNDLFTNNKIKIAFVTFSSWQQTDVYDRTPDNGGYEYTFQAETAEPLPFYSIKKTNPGYLRIAAYNIEQDGIINPDNTPEFNHIFDALEPEIIGICEAYDASSQQVADRIEFFLPSGDGEQWYNQKEGAYDIVLVSRFEIKESFTIDSDVGHDASGAFLLDLRPKYDSDMLAIVAHPKCCSGQEEDEKRQNQFDAIIAFLRDAVNPGGDLTISPNIPIVVMGDMNLVGDSRQYETLITGDIRYNGNYGDDFSPDWDGGNLDDTIPYATNTGMTYTTNPGSFPPGRLDFMVYAGSVMKVVNSFIFDTGKLSIEELNEFGLNANDTKVSDHLPVVADFDLSPITDIKKKDDTPKKFGLRQNYPNPFNPATTIKFTIPAETQHAVSLRIYNPLGQEIKTLINQSLQPGNYEVDFNASTLSSGIYYYKLTAGNFSETKKMVLIK